MDSAARNPRRRHCRRIRRRTATVRRQFDTSGHNARLGGVPDGDADASAPIDASTDRQPLDHANRNTSPCTNDRSASTHAAANTCGREGQHTDCSADACSCEHQHALAYSDGRAAHNHAHSCSDAHSFAYARSSRAHSGGYAHDGGDGPTHSDRNARSRSGSCAHTDPNGYASRSLRRRRLPRPLRTRAGNVPRQRHEQPVPRLPRQHPPRGIRPRTRHLRGTGRVVQRQHQQLRDLRSSYTEPTHSLRRRRLPRPLRTRTGHVPRQRHEQPVPRLPRQRPPRGLRPRTRHLRGTGRVVQRQHQQLRDLRSSHAEPTHSLRRRRLPRPLRTRTGNVPRQRHEQPVPRLPRQHPPIVASGPGRVTFEVQAEWSSVSTSNCGTFEAHTPSQLTAFGDGVYLVPSELAPGTYRANDTSSRCLVYRDNTRPVASGPGRVTFEVQAEWSSVSTSNCGTFEAHTPSQLTAFGDGVYLVPSELAPGTYRANDTEQPVPRLPRQHPPRGIRPRTRHLRGTGRVVQRQHQQLRDLRSSYTEPTHSLRRRRLPRPFRTRAGHVPRQRHEQPVPRLPRQHPPRGIRPGTCHLRRTSRMVQRQHQQLRDLRARCSVMGERRDGRAKTG